MKTAEITLINFITINTKPSKIFTLATEYVNIRAIVTWGFADIVLEVDINIPPTRSPTTSETLFDF
jgi:hypothetical protein